MRGSCFDSKYVVLIQIHENLGQGGRWAFAFYTSLYLEASEGRHALHVGLLLLNPINVLGMLAAMTPDDDY
jgi:hypothetical protein